MTQQQVKDQCNEKNTAYADATTMAVTRIAEPASEQTRQLPRERDDCAQFSDAIDREGRNGNDGASWWPA